MKSFVSIAFIIAIIFSSLAGFCQYNNLEFVENKGQWDERVKFKGLMNSGAFFLQQKGFRVLLSNKEDSKRMEEYFHGFVAQSPSGRAVTPSKDNLIVRSHAYDLEFVNAGNPAIVPDKALNTYNNYFIGNDPSKWKGNCRIYQAVTYKNLYAGIDVRYYTNNGLLKYDIIANPGADVSRIQMKYTGVDGLEIRNEELVIKTSVGEMRELAPYAYQVVNGVKKEVKCRFKVIGQTVFFDIAHYSKADVLIIDPSLVFSTFTGSTGDNWGYTATYGPDGSFYAGGIVFGKGFPTSPGAFQTEYKGGTRDEEGLGGYDIGIMKFSPDGSNRTYATYIGGGSNEQPHSLVVDGAGSLIIAGRSNSADFPVTANSIGTPGRYDIILTKLNPSGSLLVGSRKIGGSSNDGVNIRPKYPLSTSVENIRRNYGDDARSEVILDNDGNILLASNTQSNNFPLSANAFQSTFAGKQDGVFIKVSPDLSQLLFSSFLGGSENDAAFVLAINPKNNNIYIGGNTASDNLPGDKTDVLFPGFQAGACDGFVSVITPAGSLVKTSYMGTSGNDMLYGLQFDKFGYPYIMGTTTGSWTILNAAFSQAGGKQFISKLEPDLSNFVYSTVFGTNSLNPNISPIAFLVDRCENVYVSGWGGQVNNRASYPNSGTAGLPVTADAIQSTTDNSDFYFFVLERNAVSQLYGSFFGQAGGFGEHVDGGTSRFDRNGVIYQALCANCGRDAHFPTTPGVWSPSNGSESCNLAAVKIAFNLAGVAGSIRASINGIIRDTSGCVPLTVDFADTIAAGKRYVWNFSDESGDIATADPVMSHTFSNVGNYKVRLVSIDSSKCNIADTAYTTIRVRTNKAVLDFLPRKLPPCDSSKYEFTNTSYVSPAGVPFSNTSFRWEFGDNTAPVITGNGAVQHSFPGPGVYKVKLVIMDTNFCNAPDSIEKTLRIASNVKAEFLTPARGCAPYTAFFDNISAGGQQFIWNFGDNTTSTEISPEHLYNTPGTYTIKLKAIDSSTCNIEDSTSTTITVSTKPISSFTIAPDPPQTNTPVEFSNGSIGAALYLWKFGDGDTLLTRSALPIEHTYNETKTFNSCLIAMNNSGCADTACQDIVARIIPLLDVPTAFTPNGDGINDKVYVRGFGIRKMVWRIYNRWGTLVFQTNNRTIGWDGTYMGSPQPKEVYHYVLSVEYADETKYQKKGDITLLR